MPGLKPLIAAAVTVVLAAIVSVLVSFHTMHPDRPVIFVRPAVSSVPTPPIGLSQPGDWRSPLPPGFEQWGMND